MSGGTVKVSTIFQENHRFIEKKQSDLKKSTFAAAVYCHWVKTLFLSFKEVVKDYNPLPIDGSIENYYPGIEVEDFLDNLFDGGDNNDDI
ncbi:5701_t:CDS:2 [Entrophospora sp. SA101]|nr:5701_t:CDS:2 [Entrophospora sp. SA101]